MTDSLKLALRTSRYMRNSLGFYPTNEKNYAESLWGNLNVEITNWLKENKITGKNTRENFKFINEFCVLMAQKLHHDSDGYLGSSDACVSLVYATLYSVIGAHEEYISKLKK